MQPEKLLYWEGLARDAKDEWAEEPAIKSCIEKLWRGQYRLADLDLKVFKSRCQIYSARVNRRDRLLFTTLDTRNGRVLLLLERIENHDYQKSRFMRKGVLSRYMSTVSETDFVPASEDPIPQPAAKKAKKAQKLILEPMKFVLGRFLSFSTAQEAAQSASLPLIMSGAAGTGKTCVAQALLEAHLKKLVDGTVLYIAKSDALVKMMKAAVVDDTHFECLTYTGFVEQNQPNNTRSVAAVQEFYHFQRWLDEDMVNKGPKSAMSKLFESEARPFREFSTRMYEEFRILSGLPADDLKQQYVATGLRQKLFSEEDSDLIVEYFAKYQRHMAEDGCVDYSFLAFESATKYDVIVVDESQDLSHRQLSILQNAARNHQIAYCIDCQQSLHDIVSSREYLHRLLAPHNVTQLNLPETYRTPLSVLPLVNRLLYLRRNLLQGKLDKHEYTELKPSSVTMESGRTGAVVWESVESAKYLTEFAGKSASFAVLVGHEEYVGKARELFDTPLVFTIEQVKGLEYAHFILFNMFCEKEPLYKEVEKYIRQNGAVLQEQTSEHDYIHLAKDKTNTRGQKYACLFNKLFISFTRTTDSLYIVQQDDKYKHISDYLRGEDLIKRTKPQKGGKKGKQQKQKQKQTDDDDGLDMSLLETTTMQLPNVAASTAKDWKAEIARQESVGNYDLANLIRSQKKIPAGDEDDDKDDEDDDDDETDPEDSSTDYPIRWMDDRNDDGSHDIPYGTTPAYVKLHPMDPLIGLKPIYMTHPDALVPQPTNGTMRNWGINDDYISHAHLMKVINRPMTSQVCYGSLAKGYWKTMDTPEVQFINRLIEKKVERIRMNAEGTQRLSKQVYVLRIAVVIEDDQLPAGTELNPPVWRRVKAMGGTNLQTFCEEILGPSMGWCAPGYHSYCVTDRRDGAQFGTPERKTIDSMFMSFKMGHTVMDAAKYCLADLLKRPGDSLGYIYDFGDHWTHEVTVESVTETTKPVEWELMAGGGQCPPEDSNGLDNKGCFAYQIFLDRLKLKDAESIAQSEKSKAEILASCNYDGRKVSAKKWDVTKFDIYAHRNAMKSAPQGKKGEMVEFPFFGTGNKQPPKEQKADHKGGFFDLLKGKQLWGGKEKTTVEELEDEEWEEYEEDEELVECEDDEEWEEDEDEEEWEEEEEEEEEEGTAAAAQ